MSDRPKKVYITGKISGLSENEYRQNFQEAADLLKTNGFMPVNPLEVSAACGNEETCGSDLTFNDGSYQHTWHCYLKADLIEMLQCDAVLKLDNAMDSKGAMLEIGLAIKVGIPVVSRREVGLL